MENLMSHGPGNHHESPGSLKHGRYGDPQVWRLRLPTCIVSGKALLPVFSMSRSEYI